MPAPELEADRTGDSPPWASASIRAAETGSIGLDSSVFCYAHPMAGVLQTTIAPISQKPMLARVPPS
jgi:hypothetical protein